MSKPAQTILDAVNKMMSLSTDTNIALKRCYDEWFFKQYFADKRREMIVRAQTLKLEEHKNLGSDIASANFVVRCSRGKIRNIDGRWLTRYSEIPKRIDEKFAISYVDLSKCGIVTEGIDNLIGLNHVEAIDLSNNPRLDDFACDMLARQFRTSKSLKEINLSFNPYISIYGLEVLFRIPSIKRLTAISTTASLHEQKELFQVAAEVERDCEVIL